MTQDRPQAVVRATAECQSSFGVPIGTLGVGRAYLGHDAEIKGYIVRFADYQPMFGRERTTMHQCPARFVEIIA